MLDQDTPDSIEYRIILARTKAMKTLEPYLRASSVAACLRGPSRWQAGGDAVVIARSSAMVGLRKPT